jgi:hypothetical protein
MREVSAQSTKFGNGSCGDHASSQEGSRFQKKDYGCHCSELYSRGRTSKDNELFQEEFRANSIALCTLIEHEVCVKAKIQRKINWIYSTVVQQKGQSVYVWKEKDRFMETSLRFQIY